MSRGQKKHLNRPYLIRRVGFYMGISSAGMDRISYYLQFVESKMFSKISDVHLDRNDY